MTVAALALPGLAALPAQAQEADSLSIQFNHHEENNRDIHGSFDGRPEDVKLPHCHGAFNPVPAIEYSGAWTGEVYLPTHIGPVDQLANYGGRFADIGAGLNVRLAARMLGGSLLKFEYLHPATTKYNGYQLDHEGSLVLGWSAMF